METEIRIRAFRAINDKETCVKFILGHQKVLENHGIQNVTSSVAEWMFNPAVFVIVVESLDKSKLYGGARVHAADGKTMLPIEVATGDMDIRVHEYVSLYAAGGTGELCGLWNSIEVAGLGIGSFFPLRASLVIAEQIGLKTLFFLCSPLTLRFGKWLGARILKEVGLNGTFYYPKLDLLATVIFLEDTEKIENCIVKEKEKILFLRKNLKMSYMEKSPFKNYYVRVTYELELPDTNTSEFVLTTNFKA